MYINPDKISHKQMYTYVIYHLKTKTFRVKIYIYIPTTITEIETFLKIL